MLDWHAVIPDGRSSSDVSFTPNPGKYLACAGPIRRIDRALSIAAEANLPLKLASNGANPRLLGLLEELCVACRHVDVEIVESHSEWLSYVENAQALLVTGPGVEALGPLVAESVAAGTPVLGFSDSEVAALLKPGHSGFIVDSTADALEVLRDLTVVDRHQCRFDFLRRFTAEAMAQAYLSVYTRLVEQPIVQAS
jgi:glycosyltransferase involved in cell wall biosynthesis